MCGIVGFITKETKIGADERKKWFINAIRAGVVRGDDGTGMFLVPHDHKGTADWCKFGGNPEEFLSQKIVQDRVGYGADWSNLRAVIGHNRSATVGSVSTANSHPFQEGPITLVHNGTLNTTGGLPDRGKGKGVDVDSHMITHSLATHSVEEVVKELDGAYVLVWHDSRDQSVNIIRNDRRPLHLLPLKYHDTLLMASEAEMLWWLTSRSSFTPAGDVYYPEPGQWMRFMPGTHKPIVKKLTMHTWAGSYGRQWDEGDYGVWYGHRSHGGRRDPKEASHPTYPRPTTPTTSGTTPLINESALNKKIPKTLAKTLADVKMDVKDQLRFRVHAVDRVLGTDYATVRGRLVDVPLLPFCQVYGLSYAAVKDAGTKDGGEMWTVAPCGMKDVGGSLRPVVLARLLSRSSKSLPVPWTATPPSSTSSQQEPKSGSTESVAPLNLTPHNGRYIGPLGDVLHPDDWMALTEKGCTLCHEPFSPEFPDEVWWTEKAHEPVCEACATAIIDGDEEVDYSAAV
jgi:hypothetical protein